MDLSLILLGGRFNRTAAHDVYVCLHEDGVSWTSTSTGRDHKKHISTDRTFIEIEHAGQKTDTCGGTQEITVLPVLLGQSKNSRMTASSNSE